MVKRLLITIRILCVMFAVLLLGGVIASISVYYLRTERQEQLPKKEALHLGKTYYLWLWNDEEMALLQYAAKKDDLYFEIAAEYIRSGQQGKDTWWLPYELDREEYLTAIVPLLEVIYVPILPESHEKVYDYGDIRLYREATLMQDAAPSRITLECDTFVRENGVPYDSCSVSILFDPQKRIDRGATGGDKYEYYKTLTTEDGYEVAYYNNEYNEGKIQPLGHTWGEVYINEDEPQYFGIAYSDEYRYGYALPKYLPDSTLRSFANHLENSETLRAAVETQWNTITLIHHGIILYGALTAATAVTLVVLTVLYQRVKKREKGSDVSE